MSKLAPAGWALFPSAWPAGIFCLHLFSKDRRPCRDGKNSWRKFSGLQPPPAMHTRFWANGKWTCWFGEGTKKIPFRRTIREIQSKWLPDGLPRRGYVNIR